MANILTRPIRKVIERTKNTIYDSARAVLGLSLKIGSPLVYAYTEYIYNSMSTPKKIIGDITSNDSLSLLKRANDGSAKAIGLAGAILVGNEIDKRTARYLSPKTAKAVQICAYGLSAGTANVASKGIEYFNNMSLADIGLDTLARAGNTAHNIFNSYNGSDLDSMVSTGIMGFVSLAGLKSLDLVVRSQPFQSLFGKGDEEYRARQAEKHFKNKARKMQKERKSAKL